MTVMSRFHSLFVALCLGVPITAQGLGASVELLEDDERFGPVRFVPNDGGGGATLRVLPVDGTSEKGGDFPLDAVARIEFDGLTAARLAGRSHLMLRNSDRILSDLQSIDDSTVVSSRPAGPVQIDRRRVLAVIQDATIPELQMRLSATFSDPPTTDDVLFAIGRSGALQQLTVQVLGVEDGQVRVRFGEQERELPLDRCAALVFGSDRGLAAEEPPRPFVRVHLRDASTITGRIAPRADDAPDKLRLALEAAEDLLLDLSDVHRIDVSSSRVLRLSDREPSSSTYTAAIDEAPTYDRGATELGEGLRLGGRIHARGFGMKPRTRLDFDIPAGQFDTFETLLGIDDRSRGPAIAIARIRIDGEIAGEWTIRGGGEPVEVSLPVPAEASRVALEADFGPYLDLGDHCVFVDPRLKRDS